MDALALSLPERPLRTGIVWPAIAASAMLHVALVAFMEAPAPRRAAPPPVELEIVEAPPPPPAPQAPPAPEPRVAAAPRPAAPVRRAPAPAPSPAASAPPPPAPAAVRIGVSLDATVAGGAFAVATGESARGAVAAALPRTVHGDAPAPFVPETRLEEPPRLLGRADPAYTDEARAAGLEGEMVLLLAIDEAGRVLSARVIAGLGHGLDEAALRAARSFRFSPARAGGVPVRTRIRFTWTFLLD